MPHTGFFPEPSKLNAHTHTNVFFHVLPPNIEHNKKRGCAFVAREKRVRLVVLRFLFVVLFVSCCLLFVGCLLVVVCCLLDVVVVVVVVGVGCCS